MGGLERVPGGGRGIRTGRRIRKDTDRKTARKVWMDRWSGMLAIAPDLITCLSQLPANESAVQCVLSCTMQNYHPHSPAGEKSHFCRPLWCNIHLSLVLLHPSSSPPPFPPVFPSFRTPSPSLSRSQPPPFPHPPSLPASPLSPPSLPLTQSGGAAGRPEGPGGPVRGRRRQYGTRWRR